MDASNVVRIAISSFILVLTALSVMGWIWAGSHQPPAQAVASRTVLGLCILAGVIGLTALWRARPTNQR
jgi:hypothetical protein